MPARTISAVSAAAYSDSPRMTDTGTDRPRPSRPAAKKTYTITRNDGRLRTTSTYTSAGSRTIAHGARRSSASAVPSTVLTTIAPSATPSVTPRPHMRNDSSAGSVRNSHRFIRRGGGPRYGPPHPPSLGRAPAKPWRASGSLQDFSSLDHEAALEPARRAAERNRQHEVADRGCREQLERPEGLRLERLGDVHQLFERDRARQRGGLDREHEQVRERRDHEPHGLRQHDVAQRLEPRESGREPGIPLAAIDREHARPQRFRDVHAA